MQSKIINKNSIKVELNENLLNIFNVVFLSDLYTVTVCMYIKIDSCKEKDGEIDWCGKQYWVQMKNQASSKKYNLANKSFTKNSVCSRDAQKKIG